MIPWKLLLKFGLPALVAGFAIYQIYSFGADSVRSEWDKANLEYQAEKEQLQDELQEQIARTEQVQRDASRRVANEIAEANAENAANVAAVRAEYSERLHNSEARARTYEHMSEAGATERANLASHAAQLDRALEQGRQLVGELSAAVEQRDAIIRSLGDQLLADRELMNTPVVLPTQD